MIQENQNFELIAGANITKPKENHKEEEQLNPQQPEDVSKPSSKIMEEPLIPKSVKIEEEKSKDASESPSKIIAELRDLKTLLPVNVKQNQQPQQPLERLTIPPQQPF